MDIEDEYGTTPLETWQADELARTACQEFCRGERDRAGLHMFLAGLLERTGLYAAVANERVAGWARGLSGRQEADDLADRMRSMMMDKIMLDEQGESFLDPVRLATGASLCGVVRQFLRTSSASHRRNLRNDQRRVTPDSFDPDESPVVNQLLDRGELTCQPDVDASQEHLLDVAEDHLVVVHGRRQLFATQQRARSLQAAWDLPPVRRVDDHVSRQEALQDLESNPRAAWTVVGSMSRGQMDRSGLTALFDGWDHDALAALSHLDPRVAQEMARAGLSARPPLPTRVSREVVARFRAEQQPVSARTGDQVRRVVQAWLTHTTTILGDEYNGWTMKPDEQVAEEAAEFTRQATLLIRRGSRFDSPEQIGAHLDALVEQVLVEQARDMARQHA